MPTLAAGREHEIAWQMIMWSTFLDAMEPVCVQMAAMRSAIAGL
jgi:hypothetical protein